jgi:hypothetical protein
MEMMITTSSCHLFIKTTLKELILFQFNSKILNHKGLLNKVLVGVNKGKHFKLYLGRLRILRKIKGILLFSNKISPQIQMFWPMIQQKDRVWVLEAFKQIRFIKVQRSRQQIDKMIISLNTAKIMPALKMVDHHLFWTHQLTRTGTFMDKKTIQPVQVTSINSNQSPENGKDALARTHSV